MRLLSTLGLLFFLSVLQAQPITVKGTVTDAKGDPVAGASVQLKRTPTGTVTNTAGEFSLRVKLLPCTLVFSAVGRNRTEATVSDTSRPVNIILTSSEAELSEVVVVGYGTESRRADVGYYSKSVSAEGLAGKVAGLSVDASSSFKTKKISSFAGDDKTSSRVYSGRDVSSRLLTAGELSDFKKWGLWKDYTSDEFKEWSSHWNTAPVHRYCIQVQNGSRKAVVGEKVYLFNSKTRDTAWQAVTDNTGKAELWAPAEDSDHHFAVSCNGGTEWNAVEFEQGINRITVKRDCGAAPVADIAFVVDATGSMADEIRYLQAELQDVITATADAHKDLQLRTGAVFYRDKGDEYLTRPFDFTTSPAELVNFIKAQGASGGGDGPEAVEDALQKAIEGLHWSDKARSRILFLVLDAPPHDEAAEKMNALAKQLAAQGIRVVPVVCSGADKGTEYLMRSLALRTNGSYVFLTDDSGIGGSHIKPTTDEFKVELLNDLLRRVIGEMLAVTPCSETVKPVTPPVDSVATLVKVSVYPNPSPGRITVDASRALKELYLTDFSGKVLLKITSADKQRRWTVDLSNYPSATYLLKYFVEDKGWGGTQVLLMR